jgi:hypothetical protein
MSVETFSLADRQLRSYFWYVARRARLVSRASSCVSLAECALCALLDNGLMLLAWGPSAPAGLSPRHEFHATPDVFAAEALRSSEAKMLSLYKRA